MSIVRMKNMELQEEKQTNEKQRRFGLELLDFVKILLVCFIVAFGIKTFIARPVFVEGSSMYPTLQDGEFGFTNLLGLSFEGVNRGDIVIVEEGDEYWVKRVIGLTKALAKEVGPSGITVNCVAPGVIATDMNAHLTQEDLDALAARLSRWRE